MSEWDAIINAFENPMRLYVGQWLQYLAFGHGDAQEASMYALRSHGIDCWGEGYGDEFRYHVTYVGHGITIYPKEKV